MRVCQYPGCEDEATSGRFGSTYCGPHNEQVRAEKEAERTVRRQSQPRATVASLEKQLEDAASMLSYGVLMAAGAQDLLLDPQLSPLVSRAIEMRSKEFARAWMAIARQNKAVENTIRQIVSGGVWIQAAFQTASLGLTIGTLATRKTALPPVILTKFCPELAPMLIVNQPPPQPAPTPSANGHSEEPPPAPAEGVYGPESQPAEPEAA